MARDRESTPSAQQPLRPAQERERAAPGKVTLTQRLAPVGGAPVQRKAALGDSAPRPPVKSAWAWTNDPWMDTAHRGTQPPGLGTAPVQAKRAAGTGPVVQREGEGTVSRGGGEHVVVRGDTLWDIAQATYGHGRYWTRIRDANRGRVFRGGHLIHPGVTLTLPAIEVPILDTMRRNEDDPEALRDFAGSISDADYQAFLGALDAEEREANAQFLQLVEMMRSSGMTMQELADEQRTFLEGEAARRGESIGTYIHGQIATHGYGGGSATWWPSLTPDEQADWEERFRRVQEAVRGAATDDVRQIIEQAEAAGGGFVWAPEDCERNGAFGFTRIDHRLYVGRRWVEAAEADPTSVFANIAHEMGGHNEYGEPLHGFAIMEQVVADLPEDERDEALSGGNSLFSTYGYMETEIFAELREHTYDRDDNPTDHPSDDVGHQLERIRDAFAPRVAEALVRGLWRRVQLDDRVPEPSKELFRTNAEAIFGITLT
ncbi:LysM peptidoglycan-binding domain-containing protein [Haliangium sp.]|uniref:LysM peptidoglycan-binding domain-containing protein n=1 Tax=Haliangium sp. TaxID=2663208 RepID=UPI003D0A8A2A